MNDDARGPWPLPVAGTGPEPAPQVTAADGEAPPVLDQLFDGDSLYALRAGVAAHAAESGLPDSRVRDVVLVVHELASNVIRHGAGRGRVRLWVTGDAVRCEVADETAPHAGADGAGTNDAAQWPVDHGHGLWLVQKVADQMSLDCGPDGSVAAARFRLGAAEGPRP